MKLLLVIAPERFRDEELFEPLSVFRKAGIACDIASVKAGTCTGMLGGHCDATIELARAVPEGYDGIVVIGGAGSPEFLWGNSRLRALVSDFAKAGKLVAAICLSPVVLARAGVLAGRRATVFRSPDSVAGMREGGANLVNDPVVVDGNFITANGPGAARKFGEEIVSALGRAGAGR
ncbi:MAG TPA: DJ-1/PfpI family protein [Methanomicrobiales archaeon]|jgi:protease I|nr:DJ-1/PfpI family protein [Methanomicrobiales archaeon]